MISGGCDVIESGWHAGGTGRRCSAPHWRGVGLIAAIGLTALLGSVASAAAAAAGPPPRSTPPAALTPPAAATATAVTAAPAATAAVPGSAVPAFDHIYVVVMENHELGSIVGNRHAPYINGLIHDYGLATRYSAVAHPSQPNYVALFGGARLGVHDDSVIHLKSRSIADQLQAAGRTWHVYAQDYPGGCSQVALRRGPVDLVGAAGTYARRHDPAISFNPISKHPARCAHITDLSSFDPAAADFELIVPNLINDMHDGTIAQGDAFLKAFVPYVTGSPAFANSLLVITWDEGSTKVGGGGLVPTIVISPHVSAGYRSAVRHDHYSLLHTIQNAWGIGCLRHTCTANDLAEFFTP